MNGNQRSRDVYGDPRESGRPVSSIVAVQNPPRNAVSLRELSEAVSRGFWDVDEFGEAPAIRSSLSRAHPTMLPAPFASPSAPPLWQVGIVLNSEELTELWLQQRQLNDETTFVWSKFGHTWVPLRAVPELQRAIGQAQRQDLERATRLPALPVPPVVPDLSRLHNGGDSHLTSGRAWRVWLKRVRSFVERHMSFTDQASILFSRDAHWLVRKRALIAVSRHRSVQASALALVFVSLLLGFSLHSSRTAQHTAQVEMQPKVSSRGVAVAAPSSPSTTVPREVASSSAPTISVESLPLVSEAARSSLPRVNRGSATASVKPASLTLASEPATVAPRASLPFDVSAARRSLDYAASRTRHCTTGDMSGSVVVTFQPSGAVADVNLSSIVGDVTRMSCVIGMFRNARVAPFSGGPVAVKKSFHVTH